MNSRVPRSSWLDCTGVFCYLPCVAVKVTLTAATFVRLPGDYLCDCVLAVVTRWHHAYLFIFCFLLLCHQQMFQMRDRAYQSWQTAQSNLTKKKEAEMKFKVSGKSDKLAQVQAEIQDVGGVGWGRVGLGVG